MRWPLEEPMMKALVHNEKIRRYKSQIRDGNARGHPMNKLIDKLNGLVKEETRLMRKYKQVGEGVNATR